MWRLVNYFFSADKNETSKMATRINKYLSEVGYCSRREADRLILAGKVTINGEIPEIGSKVEETDKLDVKGQRIEKSTIQKNIYSKTPSILLSFFENLLTSDLFVLINQ